ncbi:MAG: hypothetical protein M3134_12025 [Actinomycetota bacterium]|nr:hypothetical protein [Actinomycetota bacterium]
MRRKSLAVLAGLLTLTGCTDDGSERAGETALECQSEATDGCLTLRNSVSAGPAQSYVYLSNVTGDPVRQYGLASKLHFGRGNTFTRPLEPGEYVVSFFEGLPREFSRTSWMSTRACGRRFRIETGRIVDFRLKWPEGQRCTLERR